MLLSFRDVDGGVNFHNTKEIRSCAFIKKHNTGGVYSIIFFVEWINTVMSGEGYVDNVTKLTRNRYDITKLESERLQGILGKENSN